MLTLVFCVLYLERKLVPCEHFILLFIYLFLMLWGLSVNGLCMFIAHNFVRDQIVNKQYCEFSFTALCLSCLGCYFLSGIRPTWESIQSVSMLKPVFVLIFLFMLLWELSISVISSLSVIVLPGKVRGDDSKRKNYCVSVTAAIRRA